MEVREIGRRYHRHIEAFLQYRVDGVGIVFGPQTGSKKALPKRERLRKA
jgi:hypothetical protein